MTALTVLFLPESAYGPTNQCIGLGDLLLKRGHRVAFTSESSWAGRLAPLGFEERLVDLAAPDPDAGEGDAGQFRPTSSPRPPRSSGQRRPTN